ncbi:hypothetical protein CspeluHIS016_0308670 [Cutaneotrichosporon spelunceum]|uniref:Adenylate cyclase n=1 Tax=Cutaneotrichosporon spelunceum TaxID=1672016 RepID=A0AAD3TUZ4_9TREE|nr:hypothetical protein CspeluHIS016_0308670 [Cutaneotrichosporon spelunceum]
MSSPLQDKNGVARDLTGSAQSQGDANSKLSPAGSKLSLVSNGQQPTPSSHGADEQYPGVVTGGFGFDTVSLTFDDSMTGILDPSAQGLPIPSATTPGVNIAPWELESTPPSSSPTRQPSLACANVVPWEYEPPAAPAEPPAAQQQSFSATADWSSIPEKVTTSGPETVAQLQQERKLSHFPRFLRGSREKSTDDDDASAFQNYSMAAGSSPSLHSSSSSSLLADGAQTPTNNRSQSFMAMPRAVSPPPTVLPGRATSIAHHPTVPGYPDIQSTPRARTFGSVATGMSSSTSIQSEGGGKKGGRFLGGLFGRKSGRSASNPTQMVQPEPLQHGIRRPTVPSRMSVSTTASSIRKESIGSMSSQWSSSSNNTPPSLSMSTRLPSFNSEGNISPLHEDSENDDAVHAPDTGIHLDTNFDDMDDIVNQNLAHVRPNTFGTVGASDTSTYSAQGTSPSNATSLEANSGQHQFSGQSPIGGSAAAEASPEGTPSSPYQVSPRQSMTQSATSRRPSSQIRNMRMQSISSENSDASSMGGPIEPSWAQGLTGNTAMFNNPFEPRGSITSIPEGVPPMSPGTIPVSNKVPSMASSIHGATPAISPFAGMGLAPSWAAPESWDVENEDDEGDESIDSSSGTEGEWAHDGDHVLTPTGDGALSEAEGDGLGLSPVKQRTMSIFPLKRGGHGEDKGPKYFTRIYRDDGSYDVMQFPLHTTVSEMISILSGVQGGKKAQTTMKLYIRERGQDRQMQGSERPMALQTRRFIQAGYTDHEKLDEIGQQDMSILGRFIFQKPVLPVMNPEEESAYESFEFIDLSGRDLQVLPIFLHLHADQIIILNISRNPMTDIPLDFIQACTSLKELRMSNMALKRVPASIRESKTLARLDLSSNRIADLESSRLHNIETLTSLKVQNNRLSSVPSYFLQMSALKYLNISNNSFEDFPTIVCEMSNLLDLDVSFNNIKALPDAMVNLQSLERLICIGNEITEFPECFSTLQSLRVLDVRRNQLTDLTPVYALPNLTTLRADSNHLVTLDTQLGSKVRDFSVPHNSITRFTLAPMPGQVVAYALTQLNLSHGKLSGLDDQALGELVNLTELNLSFNQFTRLPSTLDKLVNLEVFLCTDNMLASLPENTLGRMQKLRSCNIHNNNLKEVPEDIWLCGSLEIVNVSSNLLDSLPDPPAEWYEALKAIQGGDDQVRKLSTASALTIASALTTASVTSNGSEDRSQMVPPAGNSLKRLYLGDNQLTEDVFHQIQMFTNLHRLNVSFNQISEIPLYTLRYCKSLEMLFLSGNKLTNLPSEDLELLTQLRVLHLNGNKLQTLPSELASLKHLEHLDVGSNVLRYNISNWPYDWNWNWNTALRYLNLSGNKRLEIKPTGAQDLGNHNAQYGAATHRRDLSDFSSLKHLKILGLMDVTLRIPLLPDESDDRRVRTSFSDINNMKYGISDTLNSIDHLSMFDLAVPHFRGSDKECLFGMFGRSAPSMPSGKIPRFVQQHIAAALLEQLQTLHVEEAVTEALRRTFLYMNRAAFDSLSNSEQRNRDMSAQYQTQSTHRTTLNSRLRTGASGAVVYVVDKTLHVANAGDILVVLSRKGEAELLGVRHDPTDREETARIRRAEAWVSPKGLVNDDKEIDISRAFGFYHSLPAVNASPEIRTRQLQETDEFIIIGNSALWKYTSFQTAVDIARTERDDPMMAAQKLRDFALSYGAEGSIMVMVVNVSDLFGTPGGRTRALTGGPTEEQMARRRRGAEAEFGDRTLNRLQQEIEPPTGTVALVFTDIVNSTVLWETNPGMPTAIKMHHNLFRRQLRLDGGYEVKTEGDAFMVSFQSVTAAILWAFNCQIGLLHLEWPRELLDSEDGKEVWDSHGTLIHRGLRVRMGIHWGTPECERDPITHRMDYYGPMVNRAARIQSSADGGQLMASQDVLNILRELREYIESSDEHSLDELSPDVKREVSELRRIGGIEVKDVGEKKLKGLEVPERLSLMFPKPLAGRLELFTGLRANAQVTEQKAYASEKSIEETRQLSMITLRLEAVCALVNNPTRATGGDRTPLALPIVGGPGPRKSLSLAAPKPASQPNAQWGPLIRDNVTDDELVEIITSLTTRIENCLSTLYLKQVGGFSTVVAALEQATRIDKTLLVHALSLMNGSMA